MEDRINAAPTHQRKFILQLIWDEGLQNHKTCVPNKIKTAVFMYLLFSGFLSLHAAQ
jgi:hypothetical protein